MGNSSASSSIQPTFREVASWCLRQEVWIVPEVIVICGDDRHVHQAKCQS